MSALQEALKTLGPTDFSGIPLDDLKPLFSSAFSNGQLIVDSVPGSPSSNNSILLHRQTNVGSISSSGALSGSETLAPSAHSLPLQSNLRALQKEWKPVKLNPKDNPLGLSVYKLDAKDGKGSWFARRSIHEGLEFENWKRGLEREFFETMKGHSGTGQGNIRGIGAEKRVEYKRLEGAGKMEVYLLSAQFPRPTTPRDFVTLFLTSDQLALDVPGEDGPLRHYMVISRPCLHKDTAPRDGYVRGQYESVEYIREVPMKKTRLMSTSTTDLKDMAHKSQNSPPGEAIIHNAAKNHPRQMSERDVLDDKRAALKNDLSPREDRTCRRTASNPVEWIMITRSDPGGSVPRFMVERGTPNGIVADASKFLNWANSKDMKEFDSDEEMPGAELGITPATEGGSIPAHTSAVALNQISAYTDEDRNFGYNKTILGRCNSNISSMSSDVSFASALEVNEEETYSNAVSIETAQAKAGVQLNTRELKQLDKLDKKKKKLDEKLSKAREKEANKRSGESMKDEEALRKAEEKHRKEVERLERTKQKEIRKAEEKQRKISEKDGKVRLLRELVDARAEANILRTEREHLMTQVSKLQAANKALVEKAGRQRYLN